MIMLAAALLAAQPAGSRESAIPTSMPDAFAAWQQCLIEGVEAADRAGRPRAVADAANRACRPRRDAMVAAHSAWLEGTTLSVREKRESRRTMERGIRNLRRQLIRLVRERQGG